MGKRRPAIVLQRANLGIQWTHNSPDLILVDAIDQTIAEVPFANQVVAQRNERVGRTADHIRAGGDGGVAGDQRAANGEEAARDAVIEKAAAITAGTVETNGAITQ